jgi:glycosyltransferase involved in cell wall biosynthesis
LKLAILAARLPPANDGVGDHAHMLALALGKSGNDVTIVGDGRVVSATPYELRLVGSAWGVAATLRAIVALHRLAPEALLVEYTPFLYGVRSFAPLVVLLAARALGIRCAIVVHEAFYQSQMPAVKSSWKAALFTFRDAATIRAAHVIAIASVAKAAAIVERLPAFANRVVVVPIGSNIEPGSDYRHAPDGHATIVSFGVVMPRRRLEYAVAAVAALVESGRDVRLQIIGRTYDPDYAELLARLAAENGIADRVAFSGELAPAALSRALGKASVAVHVAAEGSIPSSGSLLALLAHGIPTVALRTEFDDRIFEDAIAFSDDDGEIARSLDALLSQPTKARRLSDAARVCYQTNFAWPMAADRLSRALATL